MASPPSFTIPATMRAVIVQENSTVAVENVAVPTLDDNDILVKVEAVAQNPTDWKHVDLYSSTPRTIIGSDFSGTVVKLGKRTTGGVALGDHVAGFVQGGYFRDRGAFAEYVKTDADLVWVVPPGTLSHEEASTMGCALYTAIQMFYNPTCFGLPLPPATVPPDTWFFVYGGSTSVGQYVIQLARLAGYKVAATASPHNHALLKTLGASAVVDYRAPDAAAQLVAATKGRIHIGLDTLCSRASQALSVRVFGAGPGALGVLQGPDYAARRARPDISFKHTLIYTALGRPFTLNGHRIPAVPEDRAPVAAFLPRVPALVKSRALTPNPVRVWPGGLGGVGAGFRFMMEGRVSGEKLVYRVPES